MFNAKMRRRIIATDENQMDTDEIHREEITQRRKGAEN
jgi:hypothetical protein